MSSLLQINELVAGDLFVLLGASTVWKTPLVTDDADVDVLFDHDAKYENIICMFLGKSDTQYAGVLTPVGLGYVYVLNYVERVTDEPRR